jgi:hypothetical protein
MMTKREIALQRVQEADKKLGEVYARPEIASIRKEYEEANKELNDLSEIEEFDIIASTIIDKKIIAIKSTMGNKNIPYVSHYQNEYIFSYAQLVLEDGSTFTTDYAPLRYKL